ncbi:PREDICTED: F-box protein At5g07610-like [Nelumbo nucifera]|uniref:F-box protein At5g07610-like n=1 Tax=Nelumbo nucifera TaxID=4432 RepID=A0A1U8A991_NELNU|nr:PREDICTED: F-box protein At5g07610-like [Nelumbo nucifera]
MISCKLHRTGDQNSSSTGAQHSSAVITNSNDLLSEILLRLPVKSLVRFKSVSKQWLSQISNPRFTHNHCLRNPSSVSGLFLRISLISLPPEKPNFDFISLDGKPTMAPFKSLMFSDDHEAIDLKQSCNGLLCCRSFRRNRGKHNYYIYNPVTKQYTTLPQPKGISVFCIHLAFDPQKSPHYKAVCVSKSDTNSESYQIEIYSSETGPWRLSKGSFSVPLSLEFDKAVFWNGAINWYSFGEASLYFNVDQECLQTMPMPPLPEKWDTKRCRYFGESQGHLHLIEMDGYNAPCTTHFDVFEMERDYSQ